jgi:hypothetical protein
MMRSLIFGAVLMVSVGLAGCSISWSISESSESLGSSSESSSPKDEVGKAKIPYRDDIANMTMSVAGSNFSSANYLAGIGRIAAQRGISDWASEKVTYYGIGKGLKKAGIAKDAIGRQAFLTGVLAARPEARAWIEKGYRY